MLRPIYQRAAHFAVALALAERAALAQTPGPSAAPAPGGLTLMDVLRSAVERHPLVDAARARVGAARGARMTAGTLPNPILSYQVENVGFPGRTTPVASVRETQTFATLPLEPLWQRSPRVHRANEDVLASEARLTLARREVAIDAARAFFRLALAQVNAAAAAEAREGLDSLVRYTTARVNEGATAEGDLIRLQVERDRAATAAVTRQVELVRAQSVLAPYLSDSVRVGALPRAIVAVDDAVVLARRSLPPAETFAARVLTARPDVVAARAQARGAAAELTLQHTLLVRQLGATFGAKSTGGTYSMMAGLSAPLPMFDQNRGEVQRADGERSAAERELAWTERLATAEVAGAYEAARLFTTQVAALDGQLLTRAAQARGIAVAAYQEGAGSLLQVIDATRTLADARATYYEALFARAESLLALYAAAGFDPADAMTIGGTR